MLPKATEENKNVLLRLQTEMLKTYNIAKRLEPTTASAERTIECDGRKVPYFDYHNRAKAAMQNRGAKERAEEVKAAFLEAAKQIPADQRQEILDRMGQQKEIPTMGRLQYYQAEAEARRQLDTALKQEAQTRERNRTHDRDRGI